MSGHPEEGVTAAAVSPEQLGPFTVSAERPRIDAFCRATGWPELRPTDKARVPHTFPMLWLSGPHLRAALEAKLRDLGGIAIHESQSFAYQKPLEADRDYRLNASLETLRNPDRLILRVSISEMANDAVLDIETILRVVGIEKPSL
jgi:hypothetical protein